MNASGASKVLPIILTAITLATAVFFYKQRQVLRQKTQELLSQSSKQTPVKPIEPTPTPTITKNPIVIPTRFAGASARRAEVDLPADASPQAMQAGESSRSLENTRDDTGQPQRLSNTVTKTTTICTPVYGMANTCAEHAVVDTALDTSIFYNLAGLSYFAGLAAFIKAKKRA